MAGKLSRNRSIKNVKYLGVLSRLKAEEQHTDPFDYLCLLSGPEPQRSLLEAVLIEKAIVSDKKIVIVRGTQLIQKTATTENVKIINMPTAIELSQLIRAANTIVCRSGYSTLMDLKQLQKEKFIFVPTPGQAEQIYLANYWKEKFSARVIMQDDLDQFIF